MPLGKLYFGAVPFRVWRGSAENALIIASIFFGLLRLFSINSSGNMSLGFGCLRDIVSYVPIATLIVE
jgi:hypothetical protein